MNIQTAPFINLSEIATILGEDIDDLTELVDGVFTWGDTDVALVSLPRFLGELSEEDEEVVMEALWDVIGTDTRDAMKYFVNLAA